MGCMTGKFGKVCMHTCTRKSFGIYYIIAGVFLLFCQLDFYKSISYAVFFVSPDSSLAFDYIQLVLLLFH